MDCLVKVVCALIFLQDSEWWMLILTLLTNILFSYEQHFTWLFFPHFLSSPPTVSFPRCFLLTAFSHLSSSHGLLPLHLSLLTPLLFFPPHSFSPLFPSPLSLLFSHGVEKLIEGLKSPEPSSSLILPDLPLNDPFSPADCNHGNQWLVFLLLFFGYNLTTDAWRYWPSLVF